jgi:uncharacterized protein with ATP-grasp and redox domains
MKAQLTCIPCLVRQATNILAKSVPEGPAREEGIRRILAEAAKLDYGHPTPVLSGALQAVLRTVTGVDDPFAVEKHSFTQMALGMLPEMEALVAESSDPFEAAVKMAIAGNVIDLGVKSDLSESDAEAVLRAALAQPLHGSARSLKEAADNAGKILYLADNAGETVFDRLLLARLPKGRVTIAVRGRPVMNDATLSEAREAGLDEFGPLLPNGAGIPGTYLPACSPEFTQAFREANLVISKGQGSFETLWDVPAPLFFLFRIKCPIAQAMTGIPLNANAAIRSPKYREKTA